MHDDSISSTVPARAALAGNPSDGHGGAVVATVITALGATVTATPGDRFGVSGFAERFSAVDDVAEWIAGTHDGDQPLIQAALVALTEHVGAHLRPHRFEVATSIPRSLGLAGSSAIVVATIRTMMIAHAAESWSHELSDRPDLVASVALEAERDVLGIAAGLQDRVVQSLGGTVAMEFGDGAVRTVNGLTTGTYRRLTWLPDGMFVAFRDGTGGDSGRVHDAVDTSSRAFADAMRAAADAAREAVAAIERADVAALGDALNTTFDQRARVYPLDPAHVEMVHLARAHGAAANYTGSGGSIVVLAPDGQAERALTDLGCTIVPLSQP